MIAMGVGAAGARGVAVLASRAGMMNAVGTSSASTMRDRLPVVVLANSSARRSVCRWMPEDAETL